ncbi:MAG: nuclear transport factor 2 family protein [Rhodanobacteraceae bacterium]
MRISIRIVMIAGTLFAGCAHASSIASSAQQQVQAIWDGMQHAANTHDTDRFMAPFEHQQSLIFAINGEVIHGWDALRAQQLKWWQNGKSDAVYTQRGNAEFMPLTADLMLTTSTLASRRTMADGKVSNGTFVVTYVWKKLPQGWRIVYGHESWAR